ncbi:CLUMA_CG000351, isoform A [Clunio marinus]|uniref:CLUMA_CG000351, isoform A n=1 Tax=Clunio marinus TaxID=568069 RepID=A0A1J1HEB0_9DIPT|nr:CLUMA_CG000351, isoform A [Clunio marinus]
MPILLTFCYANRNLLTSRVFINHAHEKSFSKILFMPQKNSTRQKVLVLPCNDKNFRHILFSLSYANNIVVNKDTKACSKQKRKSLSVEIMEKFLCLLEKVFTPLSIFQLLKIEHRSLFMKTIF